MTSISKHYDITEEDLHGMCNFIKQVTLNAAIDTQVQSDLIIKLGVETGVIVQNAPHSYDMIKLTMTGVWE